MMRRAAPALLALALSSAAAGVALADGLQTAQAETDSACTATLTVRETFERRQALDFRCPCGCGGNGTNILTRLLRLQFGESGPSPAVDQLFVGRLMEQLPEVAEVLAFAAAAAPAWNGTRAWNDPGYANDFVRSMLNLGDGELYHPLREAFALWNIRIEVASVEKVQMAVPAILPYGARLLADGADPQERVPFDAVVSFRLTPGG